MSKTGPSIPPPFGANTGNPSSPNRAGNPIDNINNITTTNVVQNVVDENLLQLLDSGGGSHVTNVLEVDKEDFSSWKDRGFFEKQKLIGPNFIDWYRQLRIVLSIKDKLNYLEQPIPPAPVVPAEQELLQTTRDFHSFKQEEGQSVSSYVLKMKGYIDYLERLGHLVTLFLGLRELVVQGLRASRKLKLGALSLYVGNGQREAVEAIDVFYLCLPSRLEIVLNNCHYDPSITRGVISVSRLYEDSFINRFVNNTIQVSRNNMVYFSAILRDAKLDLDSTLLWHCRLGHISKKCIEKLQHDGLLNSTNLGAFEKYVSCMSRKMARKPYTHQMERAKDLLGLIHTDVCGPFKIMSRHGASYFVTFTDDFSRYGYVYLLKHKHEMFETFKVFQKEVENQLGKTIKSLRSDSGGEYMSQEFLDHLKDHEIIAHCTPPYTPQHNGMSKSRNRTLLDMIRSMMSQTTLPKSFWDYALETATRILNMVPTKKVENTPYEVWHGQAPKLPYLKVWGCKALVKRDTLTKPDKLEPRSIKCIFIGYPKEMMGYSFYYPPEIKVLVSQNAEFLENDTSLNHKEDNLEIDEPQSDIIPIRRSTRTRHAPDRMCLYIDAEEHKLGDLGESANYKAALLDPESEKWLNAMNVEMQSKKDNEVWVLVELPPNGKTVVADIRAIRILIAIAAYYDYEIWKMDVKTALFNGYLNKEVYMEQLEGFFNLKYPNRVCKLKSSIYGLKCFAMKDLGEAAYILGIKIYRDRSRRKAKLSKSQGASTTAELKHMQNVPYASAVGSIMYVMRCTRLDVAFAQNVTSRFQHNPGDLHWSTVKNILKYLRNTKDMFLVYEGDLKRKLKSAKQSIFDTSSAEAEYIAAFDASKEVVWVRKFIFGLGFVSTTEEPINDNLADHFTKALAFLKHSEHTGNIGMLPTSSLIAKQSIFATLSVEAEYIAAFDAFKKAIWVRKFISELGVVSTIEEPISMYCDNTGAIAITNESGITKGARHFCAKVHYLREVIEYGDVKLEKIHTYDNLADPFTKALAFPKHFEHTRNIGMLRASSLM
nr:hypothetical protein [Tanacetum cinerariifolium]